MAKAETKDGALKIYTRGGDKGKTSLVGGARVSKSDLRLDAYGTVDEFNSALGLVAALLESDGTKKSPSKAKALTKTDLLEWIAEVQSRLFDLGSQLACEDSALRAKLPTIFEADVLALETQMDRMSADLAPLKNFILPGGRPAAAAAHMARTICRRAERLTTELSEAGTGAPDADIDSLLLRYLNRASDWCFVLARKINALSSAAEPLWKKRLPAK